MHMHSLGRVTRSVATCDLSVKLASRQFFALTRCFLRSKVSRYGFLILVRGRRTGSRVVSRTDGPFVVLLSFVRLVVRAFNGFVSNFTRFLRVARTFTFVSHVVLIVQGFFNSVRRHVSQSTSTFHRDVDGCRNCYRDRRSGGMGKLFSTLTSHRNTR